MGTTWAVKFAQPTPPLDVEMIRTRITERLEQLEQQFSTYRPQSELSRFNRATSTGWLPVSRELAVVATRSRQLSEQTGGVFDVTVAPLVELWGFGPAGRISTAPSEKAIAATKARIDYRRLEVRLDPPALRKATSDLAADFSSMAKGFASDELSALLLSVQAPNHLVQVGGDLKAHGHADGQVSWRAGIEQPPVAPPGGDSTGGRVPSSPAAIARVLALSDQALSTSGGGHNFAQIGGRRYGHIIDPTTGYPAQSALVSVSVVADTCADSSALATALFALGPERGLALAERLHLAALFMIRTDRGIIPQATANFPPASPHPHP